MYTVAQAIGNPELTANKGMAIDTAVQASFKAVGPLFRHLFMGAEYGERAPFHYSIDHGNEALIEAGRSKDRLAEFIPSGWKNFSDPYAMDTFGNLKGVKI